jgi:hypothetical protein
VRACGENAWLRVVLRYGVFGMAERGARPNVPAWRMRLLRALRSLFTPLLPDDYLEMIIPLWSTQELRGRIERIERETADAVTVIIKPGWAARSLMPHRRVEDAVVHAFGAVITRDCSAPLTGCCVALGD